VIVVVAIAIAIAVLVAYHTGASIDRRRRARRALDAYVLAELEIRRRLAALEAAPPIATLATAPPSPAPGTLGAVFASAESLLHGR